MGTTQDVTAEYDTAWDAKYQYGCKCDDGFRGPDCSQIECPSTKDPLGGQGNEMGRDCSGWNLRLQHWSLRMLRWILRSYVPNANCPWLISEYGPVEMKKERRGMHRSVMIVRAT